MKKSTTLSGENRGNLRWFTYADLIRKLMSDFMNIQTVWAEL